MFASSSALQNYERLDQVGCGGMAVVYAGRHKKTGARVAIKFLSNQLSENPRARENFAREAETLRQLKSPNIVGFVEAGVCDDRYFLIMELLQGPSLEKIPRILAREGRDPADEKDLPLHVLLDIFIGCLNGLKHAHEKGLVHRDIKPSNFIVTGEYREGRGMPKLIDFGIADEEEEDELESTVVREVGLTIPYAAPEQIKGQTTSKLSDIYSFGVLMYEKLTGRLPFPGKNQVEIFLQHTRWSLQPIEKYNKNVPKKLRDIVYRAFSKEEADRHQNCDELISSLEAFKQSYLKSKEALQISPYITQPRSGFIQEYELLNRRKSLFEESKYLKEVLSQFNLMSRRLKLLQGKPKVPKEKIRELKKMCEQLSQEHEVVKSRMKMCLGFNSEPLLLEKYAQPYTLHIRAWELKGTALTLNSIEYFITFSDGLPIQTGPIDLTERSRKIVPFHAKDQKVAFLSLDESFWWFEPYEEKVLSAQVLLLKNREKPPLGFTGLVWTTDFLNAFRHFGKNGLKINYIFQALDQNEKQVFARTSVDIIFGASLYE